MKTYADGHIGYAGQIDGRSGYGRSGLAAIRNLIKSGLHVSHFGGEYGPQSFLYPRWEDIDPETTEVIKRKREDVEHCLIHSIPTVLQDKIIDVPSRIQWTMWETHRLPGATRIKGYRDWAGLINRGTTGLVVPATQQKAIFVDSGVTVPTEIVHMAIDTSEWPYLEHKRPASRPFTFFSWSFMDARKAPLETVNSFLSAFGPNNPNVRLVMKTMFHQFGSSFGVPGMGDIQNVTIIDDNWEQSKLLNFIKSEVDACIFLSHGEGFYMPPLEALSMGLPVIVSDHSGASDFCDERYLYPVRTRGLEPCPWGDDAQWWLPDYDHAIERLREVYGNYEAALEKARLGSPWVEERWGLEHQRRDLLKALDNLILR